MPVPPPDTMSPPTISCASKQDRHGCFDLLAFGLAVVDHHQVALVAHHAAHLQAGGTCPIGESARVLDVAPAARQSPTSTSTSTDRTPPRYRGIERLVGVDRHGDVRPIGECSETGGVERLVGEEEVVGEPGGDEALDLAWRGGAEAVVSVGVESLRPSRST